MKGSHICGLVFAVLLSACGGAEPAAEVGAEFGAEAGAEPGADAGAVPAADPASATGPGAWQESLLTPEDVAGVSGLTGVHRVPRNPQVGAGGDLNFAREGDQLVLMANVLGASFFEQLAPRMAGPVSGVGDEALEGPESGPRHILLFRKDNWGVALSSFMDVTGEPLLSQDQLRQLAVIMAGRM
jgi:hypothetical protein